METDEIKNLETIKRLVSNCFSTLKPSDDNNGVHTAEIRMYDYYELASVIRNLIKLCIVALDDDSAEVPITIRNQKIDVGLYLELPFSYFLLMNLNF
ncbi:hypothetical protein CFS9_26680 [Flavobacterium sp. CFS9]|uniref:Uncharacterized protein n=1 Tax=Flavobacterium sp. CFS9 TaxID=3143118 RepID=A0AAT9H3G5_9FLAO